MTEHDKRIEAIDKAEKIGKYNPHHPSQFMNSEQLKKKRQEVAKKLKNKLTK